MKAFKERAAALLLTCTLLLSLFSGCSTQPLPEAPGDDGEYESSLPSVNDPDPVEDPAGEMGYVDPIAGAEFGLSWVSEENLNPYRSDNIANLPIQSLLYESLFVLNTNFEAEPVLCKSYSVSESLQTWRFEIYDNIYFSDGTNMTAEDVVASLNAANKSDVYRVRFRFIYGFTVTGEYTFSAVLAHPCENLAVLLDLPILKEETLADDEPIGSGPYYKSGNALLRNTRWWQEEAPLIDVEKIMLSDVTSSESVRDSFEFGSVDVVYTDPYALYNAQFHGDNEPWAVYTTEMQYIGFNTKSTYMSNSTLRAAITYAIDREMIIKDIYNGYGTASVLPCSPQSKYYDNGLAASYSYNIDTFVSLFKSSGLSADPSNPMLLIVSNNNTHRRLAAQYIAKWLTSYGLYTTVEVLEYKDFLYALRAGEFDMYLSEIRLPPNFDLYCFFTSGYYPAVGGIISETLQEMMNQALENNGNYYEIYKTIMQRGLMCPVMFKTNVLYTSRGTLNNTSPGVSNLLQNRATASMKDIKTDFVTANN